MYSIGFVKEGERLCFRLGIDAGSKIFEGIAAVEDILRQHAQYQEIECVENTLTKDDEANTETGGDTIHKQDQRLQVRMRSQDLASKLKLQTFQIV